jgi:hypothetical protein
MENIPFYPSAVHDVFELPQKENGLVRHSFKELSIKKMHHPVSVRLYALLWTKGFLMDGSAG